MRTQSISAAIGIAVITAFSLSMFNTPKKYLIGVTAITSSLSLLAIGRDNQREKKKWESIVKELRQIK